MKLRLLRHATLWIEYGDVHFLIDPMLAEMHVNPPIEGTANDKRNPLVPLPFPLEQLNVPDAVMVTHLHRDHWDDAAAAALPRSIPLLVQPGDGAKLGAAGFANVSEVNDRIDFRGIRITRTDGRHGTGLVGDRMGRVSGFIFQAEGEPTLYMAGDTIWCDEVKKALDAFRPEVTVVNAGGARFAVGDPITMDADDVTSLCRYADYTRVVAVHMEAINHCLVTRAELRRKLETEALLNRVTIPEDGDWV